MNNKKEKIADGSDRQIVKRHIRPKRFPKLEEPAIHPFLALYQKPDPGTDDEVSQEVLLTTRPAALAEARHSSGGARPVGGRRPNGPRRGREPASRTGAFRAFFSGQRWCTPPIPSWETRLSSWKNSFNKSAPRADSLSSFFDSALLRGTVFSPARESFGCGTFRTG